MARTKSLLWTCSALHSRSIASAGSWPNVGASAEALPLLFARTLRDSVGGPRNV